MSWRVLRVCSDGIPTVYSVNDQATFAEVLHEDMFHHTVTFDYQARRPGRILPSIPIKLLEGTTTVDIVLLLWRPCIL